MENKKSAKHPVSYQWYQDNRRCGDGCCTWTEEQRFTVFYNDKSEVEIPMSFLGLCENDARSEANEWLHKYYGISLDDLEEVW